MEPMLMFELFISAFSRCLQNVKALLPISLNDSGRRSERKLQPVNA